MNIQNQKIIKIEDCDTVFESAISYEEKISMFATFLRDAESHSGKELINRAMNYLIHLQFKHRRKRDFGLIVTEDEYWAIRNVVWNIDKQIFWQAVGKRLLHLYDESGDQWIIFNDDTGRWEGYDAKNFKVTTPEFSETWNPWERVLNDDRAPHFKWYEGAKTNLSFNSLDRWILIDPHPHYYRYWESESWGEDQTEETVRLSHRAYLFEVTKVVMALKNIGINRHDKVALLMPEIPEAYYLIEAFHRIGVVYTSLPTSLGDQQVSDRLDNLGVNYVFTVNGGWHKGKSVFYKKYLLDCALGDFSRKSYVLRILEDLLDKPQATGFKQVIESFERRFENKSTIKKWDFLAFIEEQHYEGHIIEEVKKRLDSEPERVSRVVVYERIKDAETPMINGRDLYWDEFMGKENELRILAAANKTTDRKLTKEQFLDYGELSAQEFLKIIHQFSPPQIMEANHPRLVIYTSGSTGIPKGVVHCTLGHAIFGMYTMLVTMGPREWELMDTRATHSWITGLDYIAGMPGLLGIESVVAEGAFDYRKWFMRITKLKVNISKAGAPILRGIKEFIDAEENKKLVSQLDLSHVRICVNCAEPADAATQGIVNEIIGKDKYVNTWWPTELTGPNTGAGTSTVPFAYAMKHDASTFPLPYVKQDVIDDEVDAEDNVIEAKPQAKGILGRFVIDPHPGMLEGIYGDEDKFFESYFRRYWNKTGDQYWYDSGDGAIRHGDGYFHVIGRVGYAFNWNGHISGAEDVEGTLRDHRAVKDVMIAPIKGEGDILDCLQVFIVLNEGYNLDDGLKEEFDDFIARKKQKTFKGLMTEGSNYYQVDMYPVTMSQKSLRRFGSMLGSLTDKELGEIIKKLGDPNTKERIEKGDETAIIEVFPTRKHQNPYAGSLVGLGNYPSLIHLTYVVAGMRGLRTLKGAH
jgi:acrylyl-CoA reductase (NADPH)/3-hydroxypropionyl-CoA dehydratase/3-hydroxypropionyl-CoA synthetase